MPVCQIVANTGPSGISKTITTAARHKNFWLAVQPDALPTELPPRATFERADITATIDTGVAATDNDSRGGVAGLRTSADGIQQYLILK